MVRKGLLVMAAVAALAGAGLAPAARAKPVRLQGATVQTVQYYGGGGWREHEWRRHERWRRWHHWHHWHQRGW